MIVMSNSTPASAKFIQELMKRKRQGLSEEQAAREAAAKVKASTPPPPTKPPIYKPPAYVPPYYAPPSYIPPTKPVPTPPSKPTPTPPSVVDPHKKTTEAMIAATRAAAAYKKPTPKPKPKPTPKSPTKQPPSNFVPLPPIRYGKPPTVTIDISKLPKPVTTAPVIPTMPSEPVPSAVLESAGLVYPWQRTPEAIAKAGEKWSEAQARKAEVDYAEHYDVAKETERIETLEKEIEEKTAAIPELGFEVRPEYAEKIETSEHGLQEAYGKYESAIEVAMIAEHGAPPQGKTWLGRIQAGETTKGLPTTKIEEIGKFWTEEIQPLSEAYYSALASYVELPGIAQPTVGASSPSDFEKFETELTTRLKKIEEIQAPIAEVNKTIEEMNKAVGGYESYVGITGKIATWDAEHSIMAELDKIGKSITISDPLAGMEKTLFPTISPELSIGKKIGGEFQPLRMVTEPIEAGIAVATTPFRWVGMAKPGPIGLAMEAGIMGVTGGLGWQEMEKKRLAEEAQWLREHPGYAAGAVIGDIFAMKGIGKVVGWAGGKAKAGVRLTAKKLLPEGVKWELITKQQRLARLLGLPEEYVKVRPSVFVGKTRDVWMKAVTEGGKGYAEVGGAVREIFKPAPRWLIPKWMEKLTPSWFRTKYYAAQVIRRAAKPEWMTKSAYESIVKSSAELVVKWDGPMLTQTLRTVISGSKKSVALAVAQQSERFALKVGMHSPTIAGVSSELAKLSSKMVPTQLIFADMLASNLATAAAGIGAGFAGAYVSSLGVPQEFKPLEMPNVPTMPQAGIPEIPEYRWLEMQEELVEEVQEQATKTVDEQFAEAMKGPRWRQLDRQIVESMQTQGKEIEQVWSETQAQVVKKVQVQVEVPVETPAEVLKEVEEQIAKEVQAPAQAPAQTPAEVLKQAEEQITKVVQAPAQVPAQVSAQIPAQVSAQALSQTSAQALKQMQVQLVKTMQAQQLQTRVQMPTRWAWGVPFFPFAEMKWKSPYYRHPSRMLREEERLRIWKLGRIESIFRTPKFKMPKFEEPKPVPVRVRKPRKRIQPRSTMTAEMNRLARVFGKSKGKRR